MVAPQLPTNTIPDVLEATARVRVSHDGAPFIAARRQINFVGATLTDDPVNERVNVTTTGVPSGSAGGDIAGTGTSTYPNPTLTAIGSATGPLGTATRAPVVTIDTKGRVTALTDLAIALVATGDATGTLPGGLTLKATGPGATGPLGTALRTPVVTIDAAGRVTGLTDVAIFTPHTTVNRRVLANVNGFTNQTTYAAFPNATDKAAMDVSFTKQRADTNIVVRIYTSCELDSGAAQDLYVGVNNGTTTYDIAQATFTAATIRRQFSGVAAITGLAAGTLTWGPRFKATAASSVNFWTTDDYVFMEIMETFA